MKIQIDISNPNDKIAQKVVGTVSLDSLKADLVAGTANVGTLTGTKFTNSSFLDQLANFNILDSFTIKALAQSNPNSNITFQFLPGNTLQFAVLGMNPGEVVSFTFDIIPKTYTATDINTTADIVDPLTGFSILQNNIKTNTKISLTPKPLTTDLIRTGGISLTIFTMATIFSISCLVTLAYVFKLKKTRSKVVR
jgi:hypothetical protein